MNFQIFKDSALSWCLVAILAWGNYQLQKLTEIAAVLSQQIVKINTEVGFHEMRLDKQWSRMEKTEERVFKNEIEIAAINAAVKKSR